MPTSMTYEPTMAGIRNLLKTLPDSQEVTFKLIEGDRVEVRIKDPHSEHVASRVYQPTRLVHSTRKLLEGLTRRLAAA